jgi:tRNA-dihydrouridine synthase
VIEFRKHYAGYLRGFPHAARIRHELMQYTELDPVLDHIDRSLPVKSSLQTA